MSYPSNNRGAGYAGRNRGSGNKHSSGRRQKTRSSFPNWIDSPEYDGLTELRRKYQDDKGASPGEFVRGVLGETVNHPMMDRLLGAMGYTGSLEQKLEQFYQQA